MLESKATRLFRELTIGSSNLLLLLLGEVLS